MSTTIRFEFNPGKLAQVLGYLAWKGVPTLDKLKTVKLLYFADKEHLLKHGRPILGDVYFCMPHGPVPSFSKNLIDDALDQWKDVEPSLLKYVGVDRSGKYPQFVFKEMPDLGELSLSEVNALDCTVARYGQKGPWELRNLSHEEPCWVIAHRHKPAGIESVEMPYETFFEGQPAEVASLLELVREEQENRDFAQDLTK
jgi:uncharacterized phage-associated protein